MKPIVPLICPDTGELLQPLPMSDDISNGTTALKAPGGHTYPVVGGVPRFVAPENYAAAFGLQWKTFRKTQLDSFTGTSISRNRLKRCLGGFDAVRGKRVLEAGCGAGRFTEVLLTEGAQVFACDLSTAVEANLENCRDRAGYFVCQADIRALPVAPRSFDVVICLGVIQHTPNPEETIEALVRHVAPGGLLVIDHYRYGHEDMTAIRQRIRTFLIKQKTGVAMALVRAMVAILWPLHRLAWACRNLPFGGSFRRALLRASPVLDYHDQYGELGPRLLYAWAVLDTHDALTDRYKHKRSTDQIAQGLKALGLVQIGAEYGGNGVEARARAPG
ncbi:MULTISPECIES: bifunctional 2-polyprenyl-6-hydroxyphenol methylase/3-demethylubiquinol 3-O-methyltransferase UbiG [unclassified Bradyrhizobium]|uniref:class I SAM-dependent methyltransferase n=1 Tax=unclassified Bradyrhizobium TaxID=2631580 RepID=UPI001BA840B5|nr:MULTISPECIES: class I SAM-dependent methyltransferase [unclassified Bradyrhizobium]MBR1203967.1 methyltransferase domain-containing protein [Bradyrhizobium sp. AUGA SZCCT0124]MBR1310147.1 methyltransferase domain-containing protein [Bradyrhizobium sp. AUGA SZCCT0051]MBR1340288.1 methyltransferase domain-containing protein [Bradyrhizobium sp. AUGA SZCCT0105]MBR1354895.1 methyltransferase domain-containing protein [Bradyrhizobium sp. AUGA SZCCT0045]